MYTGVCVKYSLFLSDLMKLEFSRHMFRKYTNMKFHENASGGTRHVSGGQTDRTKLIVAFQNFANAPKNAAGFHTLRSLCFHLQAQGKQHLYVDCLTVKVKEL
jgi:hypothetical protein